MAGTTTTAAFVAMVAEEIVGGIDHATEYWLARIDQELAAAGSTAAERIRAVERILGEY